MDDLAAIAITVWHKHFDDMWRYRIPGVTRVEWLNAYSTLVFINGGDQYRYTFHKDHIIQEVTTKYESYISIVSTTVDYDDVKEHA